MIEVETELRARIDAQRGAIDAARLEILKLREENRSLRELLGLEYVPQGASDLTEPLSFRPKIVA